jgi:hypothetical protein
MAGGESAPSNHCWRRWRRRRERFSNSYGFERIWIFLFSPTTEAAMKRTVPCVPGDLQNIHAFLRRSSETGTLTFPCILNLAAFASLLDKHPKFSTLGSANQPKLLLTNRRLKLYIFAQSRGLVQMLAASVNLHWKMSIYCGFCVSQSYLFCAISERAIPAAACVSIVVGFAAELHYIYVGRSH